jgi:hypothetical protein
MCINEVYRKLFGVLTIHIPIRFFCDLSPNDEKLSGVVLIIARRVVTTRVSTSIPVYQSPEVRSLVCACESSCKRIGYILTNFLFRVLFSVCFYGFP